MNKTANVFKIILQLFRGGKATIPLAALLLLSFAGTAQAQGTAFLYQGQLTGIHPPDGSYDLTFALFDASTGGNQVGPTITDVGVQVSGDAFTVMLDFGNQFDGALRWLQIGERRSGKGPFTTLSPRQQLTPWPYAIMANSASNLLGTLATAQLSGTLANSQLANSSIIVNAGTGLSGGGTVALGGSTTLNNAGVLSVTGNDDITAFVVGGAVRLGDTATSANTSSTIVKRDSSGNFSAGTITASLMGNATSATTANGFSGSLVGDVIGTQGATVVGSVGGQTAANLASGAQAANAATSVATPNAIVQRDGSGNFSAGTITASLAGNATSATTANGFSGSLVGDVIGTQGATVVGSVGGQTAANLASGAQAANAATSVATPNAIVQRDGSGNFSAGTITASLAGNATSATTANGFSGSLAGDVTGPQSTTVVASVGGQTAANVASGAQAANAATSAATPNTIVQRDSSGNFSATSITLNGALNLPSTTVSPDIIYSGSALLLYGDNKGNFFSGQNAGNSTTSGSDNTACGSWALSSNTSGFNNTAVGVYSLWANTTGFGNVAVGGDALGSMTTGYGNIAIGPNTLNQNANGNSNTAVGADALNANTSGNNNIALGYFAGYNITRGSSNIDIGNQGFSTDNNIIRIGSGQSQTFIAGVINGDGGGLTNLNATLVNVSAAQLTSIGNANGGSGNFFVGPSGNLTTSGAYNTANGVSALQNITSGSGNTADGWGALCGNVDGSYNTACGYLALVRAFGDANTAVGSQALSGIGTLMGSGNIALGSFAGSRLQSGNNNIYIGNTGLLNNESGTIRIGTTGTHIQTYLAGTVVVPVLQITGGSDVAEPFNMSTKEIAKGAVVVIDEQNPGLLKMSNRRYDKRVAGIVSGANGVNPGLTLRQEGVTQGGQNVALSGRVYALADASNGPIKPGDLLTTSDIPGHAMKATDLAKAQGAILGKAMSGLMQGKGTVLVLVTLQ